MLLTCHRLETFCHHTVIALVGVLHAYGCHTPQSDVTMPRSATRTVIGQISRISSHYLDESPREHVTVCGIFDLAQSVLANLPVSNG